MKLQATCTNTPPGLRRVERTVKAARTPQRDQDGRVRRDGRRDRQLNRTPESPHRAINLFKTTMPSAKDMQPQSR
eukprot:7046872-Prymnesium_polylepis.1